jgi:hypothetical protein
MDKSIDTYNLALEPSDKDICDTLRRIIDEALPGAASKIWHGHPVWFLDDNPVVGYSKLKGNVRLLFWSGQSFDESGLHPEGSFKAAEARYTSLKEIDEVALNRWLEKATLIQWDYKNIVKNRGKLSRIAIKN